MSANVLSTHPVHLGRGGSAERQPTFTGEMDWYMGYAERVADDGAEGRLVAMHTFTAPWTAWEMHPVGAEVVVCTAGALTLIQRDADGAETRIELGAGDYAINPPGVWHTADAFEAATVLFITAGEGTQHEPR